MEYQIHHFPNGIRLVHKQVPSSVAHFGIIIPTGSRDESENEHGMAHLTEHMLFKGTGKRKAYNVLSRLEDVGGEINAFTTKEDTSVYSSFLQEYYERAIELIHDIIFNSSFPEKELSREKSIIMDEILSYRDTPSELIFDDFEEQAFNGLAIGRNILGSESSIGSFGRNDLISFVRNNYPASEIVLSSVGNIGFTELIALCGKYFCNENKKSRSSQRIIPDGYMPCTRIHEKETFQVHCIVGNLAYHVNDEKRTGLHLLTNILGGPGMNSRLNMSLRERNGYAYNIEAHYTPYTDSGIFMVYFGCDKKKFGKSLALIYKEFDRMRTASMGSLQLGRAKKQLTGQIAISLENNELQMLSMGKSLLTMNRVDSLKELSGKIDAVKAGDLLEIANEILCDKELSVIQYV
jgi:predicted Zn-dependent peptidase